MAVPSADLSLLGMGMGPIELEEVASLPQPNLSPHNFSNAFFKQQTAANKNPAFTASTADTSEGNFEEFDGSDDAEGPRAPDDEQKSDRGPRPLESKNKLSGFLKPLSHLVPRLNLPKSGNNSNEPRKPADPLIDSRNTSEAATANRISGVSSCSSATTADSNLKTRSDCGVDEVVYQDERKNAFTEEPEFTLAELTGARVTKSKVHGLPSFLSTPREQLQNTQVLENYPCILQSPADTTPNTSVYFHKERQLQSPTSPRLHLRAADRFGENVPLSPRMTINVSDLQMQTPRTRSFFLAADHLPIPFVGGSSVGVHPSAGGGLSSVKTGLFLTQEMLDAARELEPVGDEAVEGEQVQVQDAVFNSKTAAEVDEVGQHVLDVPPLPDDAELLHCGSTKEGGKDAEHDLLSRSTTAGSGCCAAVPGGTKENEPVRDHELVQGGGDAGEDADEEIQMHQVQDSQIYMQDYVHEDHDEYRDAKMTAAVRRGEIVFCEYPLLGNFALERMELRTLVEILKEQTLALSDRERGLVLELTRLWAAQLLRVSISHKTGMMLDLDPTKGDSDFQPQQDGSLQSNANQHQLPPDERAVLRQSKNVVVDDASTRTPIRQFSPRALSRPRNLEKQMNFFLESKAAPETMVTAFAPMIASMFLSEAFSVDGRFFLSYQIATRMRYSGGPPGETAVSPGSHGCNKEAVKLTTEFDVCGDFVVLRAVACSAGGGEGHPEVGSRDGGILKVPLGAELVCACKNGF
eukprot:CAMPEP_0178991984 /NCGR_PEP_ID=MMETSP0795-20121207/5847_1 /TAXON_ID=88552 /ORGANISM="Amoebophrya sp., Strain Ameob2" /LENGTH=748 /DNA_ID=CAMNT_0020683785 /DNA_START=418 /DNA_END=2664 /DNA_ORIENTATION=+